MHAVRVIFLRRPDSMVKMAVLAMAFAAMAGTGNGRAAATATPQAAGTASPQSLRFANPSWSPDGKWLALSDDRRNALYLYNTLDKSTLRIANSPSVGYACNWAPDSSKLGFKLLIPDAGRALPLQRPVYLDIAKGQVIPLHAAVARAGVPSFAIGGLIAFTIDQELRVVNANGVLVKAIPLGYYANLAPIAPDGTRVAWNDRNDQIWLLDLATGQKRPLTAAGVACFNPVWSPDSTRLIVSTVSASLAAIEVASGRVCELDEGTTPSWAPDSRTILYNQADRLDGFKVTGTRICQIQCDGTARAALAQPDGELRTAARISPDGRKIAFTSLTDGQIYEAPLSAEDPPKASPAPRRYVPGPPVRMAIDAASYRKADLSLTADSGAGTAAPQNAAEADATQIKLSRTVPYIHQVYDTPNDFNGHWACGATSAMMCISYYSILPYWDCTVSVPYSHVSHYGRYISQIYSYNGTTYNIGSPDPNDKPAYGGYGYIVRNNWADTKGYMRDYFRNHGMTSSVDWSPTWAELQAEVNNQYPCVLLNSLTSAGHYIVTIGYIEGQHTAIFNDPYGNKNSGYMNYNGIGVCYDWPGYNNGYENLNTVHCFIYARASLVPTITGHPQPRSVCAGATGIFTVIANGTGTLTYQWQKNSVNLSNGGHYSGVTTATLTVSNTSATDAANYRCVVTSSGGSATSNHAALTIAAATAIAGQPASQTVTLGGSASFTLTAAGGVLTYQWQKNGVDLTDGGRIAGSTTATLTISEVSKTDAATYRCLVSGACGSMTSDGAVLTVKPVVAPDFDIDGDVDTQDLNALRACLGGAGVPPTSGCDDKDVDGDHDVDQGDFGILQRCLSGMAVRPDAACDD